MPQSSPKPSGWAVLAIQANQKAHLFSFTEIDFTTTPANPRAVSSSVRTGLATPMREFGPVTIFGLGTVGESTTGTTTSAAYSGGGIAVIPVKSGSSYKLLIGVRVLKTAAGGVQQLLEIGFGKFQQ